MRVHCLFEQSGIFKHEFRKFGIESFDYDIENQFNETDFQIDIMHEIDAAYDEQDSIFSNIAQDDLIIAFFPCTRFSANVSILMNESHFNYKNKTQTEILETTMVYNKEQSKLYQSLSKLFIICIRHNFKLIVENPYTQPHYLSYYFPIKPTIIDKDRRKHGDGFKKPTQYWFVNCKPQNNIIIEKNKTPLWGKIQHKDSSMVRSVLSENYAQWFIKSFILKEDKE